MIIQHNIMALNAYRQLNGNNMALARNLEKLSSGYRINRAADDAAGLAISEKMRAQIAGLETAVKNAQDGISLIQAAEGALTEVHAMLNRMVELAGQAANGIYDDQVDRKALDDEFQQLKAEIDRISQATNFNGKNLLDGTLTLNGSSGSAGAAGKSALPSLTINDIATSILQQKKGDLVNATGTKYMIDDVAITDSATGNAALKQAIDDALTEVIGELESVWVGADITAADYDEGALVATIIEAVNEKLGEVIAEHLGIDGVDYKFEFDFEQLAADLISVDANDKIDAITVALNGYDIKFTAVETGRDDSNMAKILTAENKGLARVIEDAAEAYNKINIDIKAVEDLGLIGKTIELNGKTYTFAGTNDKILGGADFTEIMTDTDLTLADLQGSKLADGTYAIIIDADTNTTGDLAAAIAGAIGNVEREGVKWFDGFTKPAAAEVGGGAALTLNADKYEGLINLKPGGTATSVISGLVIVNGSRVTIDPGKFDIPIVKPEVTGPMTGGLNLQIGDTADSYNIITVGVNDMSCKGLGIDGLNIASYAAAVAAVGTIAQQGGPGTIKGAINLVSAQRGALGALQNRLEHTINNLGVTTENVTAAESRIRDTDMAKEMMYFTKNNILVQAAQAMLAQANQVPQGVLQLLR